MEHKLLSSRYQLIKAIGRGGFGKTYLAEDTQRPGNPLCVVKQLHPAVDEPDFLELARRLFNREAETLERLGGHSQIPRLLAYFEEEQEFYLVQEYIKGKILSKELIPGQPWSENKVIDLLRDCLGILDFVHSQGVIHRDIKPGNLIRRQQDNKLVLVDFGSVKEVIVAQTQFSTATVAIGTKGYMPTEQARGKPRFASDIYALGAVAIQALTGVHPLNLSEDKNGEIIWQGQCSPQLAEIISRMVRYHFQERYQSAQEILEQLDSLKSAEIPNTKLIQSESSGTNLSFAKSNRSNVAEVKNTNNSVLNSSNAISHPEEPTVASSSSLSRSKTVTQQVKTPFNPTQLLTKTSLTIALLIGAISTTGIYLFNKNSGQQQAEIKQIIQTLETQYQNQNYQECYQLVSDRNTKNIGLSQAKIDKWTGKCGLAAAQEKAEAKDYAAAIGLAEKLSPDAPNKREVQQNIDLWSEQILDIAQEKYTKEGKLEEATQTVLTIIPDRSKVKPKALEIKAQWEEEHNTNQNIIKSADRALEDQKWQEAKNEAAKLKNSSIYWQQQAQNIVDRADQAIQLEQIENFATNNSNLKTISVSKPPMTIDVCQSAAELCN